MGRGWSVEFQNYDWPFFSERQNCLLSLSLLQHHNVENQKEHRKIGRRSLHWKDLLKWSECQKRKRSEHQKANNHNVKKSWSLLQRSEHRKEHRNWLSMFWFYLWRQKRSQRQKSKYQLPMAYYLRLPRPVGPWGG